MSILLIIQDIFLEFHLKAKNFYLKNFLHLESIPLLDGS